VCAEARAKLEAGDVDSCGAPAELRRRSEEKLRGGEAFDNCMFRRKADIATASDG